MSFRQQLIILAATAAMTAGCQSAVKSSVTVFHQMESVQKGAKLAVLAFPEQKNNTLEFRAYRPKLESNFAKFGFCAQRKIKSLSLNHTLLDIRNLDAPMYGMHIHRAYFKFINAESGAARLGSAAGFNEVMSNLDNGGG